MATYIIGDVHGCFKTLRRLLERIRWDRSRDRLFLTGDLVNGGPDSLATVRWAREHAEGLVLGNHDLHLLAVDAGVRAPRTEDTFYDLLEAPDRDDLLQWMRTVPLLLVREEMVLVHAGLLPQWDLSEAQALAAETEARISQGEPAFFREMYGDWPRRWDPALEGADRSRVVINATTRMRMLSEEGEIDMDFKKPLAQAPEGLRPWFAVPRSDKAMPRIHFGHWAALGLRVEEQAVCLDSGCAWGGELTALRLEDDAVFQEVSELRGVRSAR
jgi:bis(5'-nucleosyl)-tetraphosphatase (symmetrical)